MTPDEISERLAKLSGLSVRAARSESEILTAAENRRGVVSSKLDELRASALAGDEDAAAHYTDLIMERGRLDQVLERGRTA